MDRTLTYRITEPDAGKRIEEFLRAQGCSHRILTHLKRTERGILLNGIWSYTNTLLKAGDTLTIHVAEEPDTGRILPVQLPLTIVYEDEDLMVINKAPDMPVHPSMNHYENTLANAVCYYFRDQKSPFVYRCINRLDRDTSGLLILAKNMLSGAILYQMSADRRIHRQYLAIAEGITPESGTIDAPIARKPDSVLMRCVDPVHGERAVTHYERIALCRPEASNSGTPAQKKDPQPTENNTICSLLRVRLETGRTHQIRVHLTSIGHPLAGDFLYHPNSTVPIRRQALHSFSLDFVHPITGIPLHFEQPLPEDMRRLAL